MTFDTKSEHLFQFQYVVKKLFVGEKHAVLQFIYKRQNAIKDTNNKTQDKAQQNKRRQHKSKYNKIG